MSQESFVLYKLIILYMLERAKAPLMQTQISAFVLDKGYTNYLTLQQAIAELSDNHLLCRKPQANRTLLSLTEEGRDTIHFFENRINDAIKNEIKQFFLDNKMDIQEEMSILSNYYKNLNGEFDVVLTAKDKGSDLLSLQISVPTESMAQDVCTNWQERNQQVYQTITSLLF